VVDAPPLEASAETVERGRALYSLHCLRCHGVNAHSGGVIADLRLSTRAVHERWPDVVLGGIYADRGMASFADQLSRGDVDAIHAFVIGEARRQPTLTERVVAAASEWVCVPAKWLAD
jgi:quinohemoprotein ethanol dehydrogenase